MDFALITPVLPELILAIGALALLMIGAFTRDGEAAGRITAWLAIGVLLAAGLAVVSAAGVTQSFDGAFISDGLTQFLKVLVLVAAALSSDPERSRKAA